MGNTREFLAVCELEAMALVRWFTVLENGDVPQQPVKLPEVNHGKSPFSTI